MQGLVLIALGGLLSGSIAIFGNSVGRFIGRRKLSIFRVRPRYTSYVITFATGLVIFLAAVLVLLVVSKPVNQMLLHRDELDAQLSGLQQKIADGQKQLSDVESRKDRVMEYIRRSDPIFHGDDVVFMSMIDCSVSPSEIEDQLDATFVQGNDYIVKVHNAMARDKKDQEIPETTKMLGYARPDADYKSKIIEQLSNLHGKHIVALKALWNIYYADNVVPVNIEVLPFTQAFRQGEVIASVRFTGKENRAMVMQGMQKFLHDDVQRVVQAHQMLPPARATRVPVEFPLEMVVGAQDDIVSAHHPVTLDVIANRDISNIDPLDARLEVHK